MSKKSLDDLIEQSEESLAKGESLDNFEVDHRGKVKEQVKTKEEKIEEKVKEKKQKTELGAEKLELKEEEKEEKPKEKTETLRPSSGQGKPADKEKKKKAKKGKAKVRSKKYAEIKAQVDSEKKYNLEEAIELVKKTSLTKFDGNVETHIRILSKTGKPEQIRGLLQYPHTTGKKTKVAILNEEMIEEIIKTGKIDYDLFLATPALMPKVAKLAKILGPKGKMPNPKAGTVTENPEKTKVDLEGGQVEYRTDSFGNIHQVIGKISSKSEDLIENYKTLLNVLPADKIKSITICATMGPGIKVGK